MWVGNVRNTRALSKYGPSIDKDGKDNSGIRVSVKIAVTLALSLSFVVPDGCFHVVYSPSVRAIAGRFEEARGG
ncbi:hypothetical protein WG66_017039 [Moniliophthora roreri]|nr:hypothetical protein WG66_017039 [Moniliophthora roreri]